MRERFHDILTKADDNYRHAVPQESYSRELDSRVQASEMPYGYDMGEPSADTGAHNERSYESRKEHKPRK